MTKTQRNPYIYLPTVIFITLMLIFVSRVARAENSDDANAAAAAPKVSVVTDLSALSPESAQRKVPILLMFAAEDCEYCERLEEDVIRPMMISGEFDRRAIVRKVMLDSPAKLKDFSGKKLNVDNYATQHKVRVTPTLMFVDANGKELAPKVIGYQTSDFYAAYLDVAIDASRDSLLKQQTN